MGISKIQKLVNDIKKTKPINTKNWKTFYLIRKWTTSSGKVRKDNERGIFLLQSTLSGLDNNKLINLNDDTYPLITRSDKNNGISRRVGVQNKPVDTGNCLTIGLDTQTIFYQSEDFYTGQNINILRHHKLRKHSGLFFCACLSQILKHEFLWGSKGATLSRLAELKIKLPVDDAGEPDWKYMEKYVKDIFKEIKSKMV